MIQQMNVGAFSESLTTSTEWQTTIDSGKNSLNSCNHTLGLGGCFQRIPVFQSKCQNKNNRITNSTFESESCIIQ